MANRESFPEEKTDFSWADEFIEERRFGKFRKLQVKFPLDTDRRAAGNIEYDSELNNREWRGRVPAISRENDDKSIKGSIKLNEAEYIFVNEAPNKSNLPDGYIATSSGIELLVDLPFTEGLQQGYATNKPTEVSYEFENNTTSGLFFIGMNIEAQYMRGERYPYRYLSGNINKDNKMTWKILPEFENPTEPNIRFPRAGAKKIK